MSDFWSDIPALDTSHNEGDVESRLVLPLLRALGYEGAEIAPKYPVIFQEGRRGRPHEADFVCFWDGLRTRDNSLLVVEAKRPGEVLTDGKAQGESYAQNLRAPLLLLTNGERLEIWQMQTTEESECVLDVTIASLAAKRELVEQLLNKAAVYDYCRRHKFKTIVEASADFGCYERAEVKRLSLDETPITRTLRRPETDAAPPTLETTLLLADSPTGAIVVAPSAYGKTTLSRTLLRQAIEGRWRGDHKLLSFDVPLPDLEQSAVPLLEFMRQRLAARHPGVTMASLGAILRDVGVTIVGDSFDRTSVAFQKRISTEFSNLLRDYPQVQLFIFSRAACMPNVALPRLELEPLSVDEMYALEQVILGGGGPQHFSIIGMMSPTLRSLCNNPFLLRLALVYWSRERDFPRKIEFLFRSWLDTILETEPSDPASKIERERALTALAEATTAAPITAQDAIARLRRAEIPSTVFNELLQCGALLMTGAVVELKHEGLADYLRAKALAARVEADLVAEIPILPVPADSFFPVLLMAQLPSRMLQAVLWKRLSTGRIDLYLDALRYRFDTTGELKVLDPERLSREYLDELIEGIDGPLAGFFANMSMPVMRWLVRGEADSSLAATGRLAAYPGVLEYKLHARELGQPRITVAGPTFPGTIRGVSLDRSRYRIGSARLLGMTLLRDTIQEAIKHLDLKGGPVWAAERLIGRVRYLARRSQFDVKVTDQLDALERTFQPHAERWIGERFPFDGERFPIRSLLEDIGTLRAAGVTALDPWWSRLGWEDDAMTAEEDVYRRVLDEEHRRGQLVYAEIVESSFSGMASQMIYYPILPIRWKLTVMRREPYQGPSKVFFHWHPVESWQEAGADVTFTDQGMTSLPDWEAARDALIKLGRPGNVPSFAGWTIQFPHNGTMPSGYFSGATSVTNEVRTWLEDDLKRLFEGLPSGDGAF